MRTQWRVGFGGPIGLVYGELPLVLRMRGVPRAKWPNLFDEVQVMEAAALEWMHREKK